MSSHASLQINRPLFVILVFLCLLIAAYASLYYLPLGIPEGSGMLVNNFGPQLLAAHAGFGSIALLLGPFQFLPGLRGRRPRVHHFIGRLYLIGVFVAGIAGLLLAFGSQSGPIATLGFGGMAVAWLFVTWQGLRTAMAHRHGAPHRRAPSLDVSQLRRHPGGPVPAAAITHYDHERKPGPGLSDHQLHLLDSKSDFGGDLAEDAQEAGGCGVRLIPARLAQFC